MTDRRKFIQKAGMGLLVTGGMPLNSLLQRSLVTKERVMSQAEEKFNIGMAGYSFHRFDIDKTLEMMQKIDVHYLCIKDFHLPFDSSEAEIAAFHKKLAAKSVTGYAVGPIYMKSKEEVDRGFDYAKRVGVKTIVGVPGIDMLPYVNLKIKDYDFNYAIHNHGPDIQLYPDASDIISHVKDLDPRIGMCLDIGHDARFGADPVADLKRYKSRIFDIHLKDVTASSKEGKACEVGRGIIDFPAFAKALREIGYNGLCSLEYEKDMDNPLAGMAESIGYFRGIIKGTNC